MQSVLTDGFISFFTSPLLSWSWRKRLTPGETSQARAPLRCIPQVTEQEAFRMYQNQVSLLRCGGTHLWSQHSGEEWSWDQPGLPRKTRAHTANRPNKAKNKTPKWLHILHCMTNFHLHIIYLVSFYHTSWPPWQSSSCGSTEPYTQVRWPQCMLYCCQLEVINTSSGPFQFHKWIVVGHWSRYPDWGDRGCGWLSFTTVHTRPSQWAMRTELQGCSQRKGLKKTHFKCKITRPMTNWIGTWTTMRSHASLKTNLIFHLKENTVAFEEMFLFLTWNTSALTNHFSWDRTGENASWYSNYLFFLH